jgi:Domain of unknown function (DUF4426)
MCIKRLCSAVFGSLLMLLLPAAQAEKSITAGDYVIHYNTLNTSMLQPEIAKTYQVTRSKNRALLMISIRKVNKADKTDVPATAKEISAKMSNLVGQIKELPLRQVDEKEAIYYLNDFAINNEDTLKFSIKVSLEGQEAVKEINFSQQFFVD